MPDKRTQLSREVITDAAVRVVAAEGLAALSMRRLALELDVWPMSVYRHFRDKEDLLDAVAEAGAQDVELPAAEGDWREQLAALAGEARAVLSRQPSELRRRTIGSPGLVRLTDPALRALRAAGLTRAAAATAWRAVLAYVLGSIELEAASGSGMAAGDAAFEAGLERVLDGIAPRA